MVHSQKFDCIIMNCLLHLLPNPIKVIEDCCRMLQPGGKLLLGGPNFNRFPILFKRTFLKGDYRKLRTFANSGINLCGPSAIRKRLIHAGCQVAPVRWLNHGQLLGGGSDPTVELGSLTAKDWMLELVC